MASKLKTPTLALAGLSMCLCLAMIGTGGRSLHVFYSEQSTNAWLLPIWRGHFDIRELQTLIGTAAVIFVLNAILAVALLVPSVCTYHLMWLVDMTNEILQLPANGMVVASALLSTLVGIVSIVYPTVLTYHAPHRDTLKTYTCRWSDFHEVLRGYGPPKKFDVLCAETVSTSLLLPSS